jgi:uncharacterized protein (TIGR02145 family)
MRNFITAFFLALLIPNLNAQYYQISFAGMGGSTSVDSVRVQNLTQCIDTSFGGNNSLYLFGATSINRNESDVYDKISIYPNPSVGVFNINFETKFQSNAEIKLYDICGRTILKSRDFIFSGSHLFTLSGLSCGVYFITVETGLKKYCSRIISMGSAVSNPHLMYKMTHSDMKQTNSSMMETNNRCFLDSYPIIYMSYHTGDLLKFTGKSGNYKTIVMLTPTQNQTVTFNFVSCTDANGNSYAVVQIGTQLWMAENMKATKYRNGVNIPNITDSAVWASITTGAYCDYHNLPAEGQQYGHLYNWNAGSDTQLIAPIGWHVSSDSEWTVLINYLGGVSIAGQKLKANCNTRWAYLDTTWGTDLVGFTALCANYRTASGAWSVAPNNDHDCWFWTSTPGANQNQAYANSLRWCFRDVFRTPGYVFKRQGCSLRCVHN